MVHRHHVNLFVHCYYTGCTIAVHWKLSGGQVNNIQMSMVITYIYWHISFLADQSNQVLNTTSDLIGLLYLDSSASVTFECGFVPQRWRCLFVILSSTLRRKIHSPLEDSESWSETGKKCKTFPDILLTSKVKLACANRK